MAETQLTTNFNTNKNDIYFEFTYYFGLLCYILKNEVPVAHQLFTGTIFTRTMYQRATYYN